MREENWKTIKADGKIQESRPIVNKETLAGENSMPISRLSISCLALLESSKKWRTCWDFVCNLVDAKVGQKMT